MGILSNIAEGLGEVADQFYTEGLDQIRHQVVEQPYFGQQTTGNLKLPEVQAPTIEAPQAQAMNGEVLPPEPPSFYPAGMNGAHLHQDIDLTPPYEPPIEPVSWQQAVRGIEPPQIEPPSPTQGMER